jgi:peptide/nickel transport system permease protein
MAVIEATAPVELDRDVMVRAGGSRFAAFRRQFRVWGPAGIIILILLLCFVGPLVLPIPKPTGGDVLHSNLSVGAPGHLLGTDPDGNDILSRLLYGGRASLEISVSVTLLGLFLGGAIGAISGYLSGGLDTLLMRILDVFIAFPSLVLTLAVAQSLGANLQNTIIALAFFSIPAFARVARGATLQLRERPFMDAAELCGTSRWRILIRHVAPNIGPQLISFALLGMGIIIVVAGALSFLGLGVQAPAPSWGNMIYQGQQTLTATPTLVLWPSIALLITALTCNVLGENLRSRWSGQ